jgi:uncharacterized protein (TIGR03083 family)
MAAPPRDAVLAVLSDGVEAIEAMASRYDPDQWTLITPCDDWDATDLAGHVLCVSGWYHQWLDRAEAGESDKPFERSALPEQNRLALADLTADEEAAVVGPVRIDQFAASARAYAERLPDRWDLPYGYPGGSVTAGLHAGVAALEWHVHAWDLGQVIGVEHRPSDPDVLVRAAATAQAASQVAPHRGRGLAAVVGRSVAARRARQAGDPWQFLLGVAGRIPGPNR